MTRAVHAEWTKLRTVSSTGWLLVAIVAVTVLAGAAMTATVDTSHCPAPTECFEDTTKLSLRGVWLGQAAVAVFAVLAATNEYGTGLIRTTLAANPRRLQVLAAKAGVVIGIVLGAGAIGVLGSLLAGRIILPGNGFTAANGYSPLSLSDGPTLRAAVGSVLYLGLIALLGLGLGTIIRDTGVAVTIVLSVLFVIPMITEFVTDPWWYEKLHAFTPTDAGLTIQATIGLEQLPIAPWAGLGVLTGYAALTTALAGALFTTRDA